MHSVHMTLPGKYFCINVLYTMMHQHKPVGLCICVQWLVTSSLINSSISRLADLEVCNLPGYLLSGLPFTLSANQSACLTASMPTTVPVYMSTFIIPAKLPASLPSRQLAFLPTVLQACPECLPTCLAHCLLAFKQIYRPPTLPSSLLPVSLPPAGLQVS